ncbi:O-antigen ligase family protein [Microbacterium paludicola]|uniref:O-antigen ligase family protein n=1 Tax=Microbacterium paludicola TaxID=300019 RepID=UPI00387A5D30
MISETASSFLDSCVVPETTVDPADPTGSGGGGSEALADPSFLASHGTLETALTLGGVAVAGLAVAFAAFKLPARLLLGIVLALGVLQFFGPFGFTSFALLATAALVPGILWRFGRDTAHLWGWLLAALAVWQTVAVLWSDKVGAAAFGVIQSVALLGVFVLARAVLREGRGAAGTALLIAAPVVALQALAAILFRALPDLEYAYLTSPVARVLTEPGVELVAAGSFDNVMDPCKAGGVFLNGNTASLFFAVVVCVYAWLALGSAQRGRFGSQARSATDPGGRFGSQARSATDPDGRLGPRARTATGVVVAGLSLVAMFATGSKTPLVLIVLLPVAAIVVLVGVRRPALAAIGAGALIVLAAVGAFAATAVAPGFVQQTGRTLNERFTLWGVVGEAFPENWFLGLGFGNWRYLIADRWDEVFPEVPNQVWPPHNLYLQAWVDAGILSLLLTLVLSILPLVLVVRRAYLRRRDPLFSRGTGEVLVVLIGLAWVIGHGAGDTTVFFGDSHSLPFFAFLVALACDPSLGERRDPDRVDQDRVTEVSR